MRPHHGSSRSNRVIGIGVSFIPVRPVGRRAQRRRAAGPGASAWCPGPAGNCSRDLAAARPAGPDWTS